jgi:hypothetical protein
MIWVSKIVAHAKVPASDLQANPANHRVHPNKQKAVLQASITELGFVKSVIVNRQTGLILDGHARVEQAMTENPGMLVDVEYVELTPDEERKALLILDASSSLATIDSSQLTQLVDECRFDLEGLQEFAVELLQVANYANPDPISKPTNGENSNSTEIECPKCKFKWPNKK